MKIGVLNGPNLNLLGEREPEIYGHLTLAQLEARIREAAAADDVEMRFAQSNHEGVLIDTLHLWRSWADGIIFNPAAYTHTSYALRDAISAIRVPVIEVHLSDIAAREPFRRVSLTAPACVAQIGGRGVDSYLDALRVLVARLRGTDDAELHADFDGAARGGDERLVGDAGIIE